MKYLILLLMCAGIAQAQPKPEIFTLSGPATFLMWNTQSAQTKNAKWTLDEKTSTLRWMGKPIVGSGHEGTIQFLSGAVTISSVGLPVQGEVVMNMNTINIKINYYFSVLGVKVLTRLPLMNIFNEFKCTENSTLFHSSSASDSDTAVNL